MKLTCFMGAEYSRISHTQLCLFQIAALKGIAEALRSGKLLLLSPEFKEVANCKKMKISWMNLS